jgi:hypothetical protein
MKKRVRTPIKILAFALGAAGCTAPEPAPAKAPITPGGEQQPTTIVAPAEAEPSRPPPPMDIGDPKINTLRAELARDKNALSRVEHYRPLCDKDGYPLVGNINSKGPMEFQPSELCREVRKELGAKR